MSPRLLDLGNKIMIGKGKRDAAVKAAVCATARYIWPRWAVPVR